MSWSRTRPSCTTTCKLPAPTFGFLLEPAHARRQLTQIQKQPELSKFSALAWQRKSGGAAADSSPGADASRIELHYKRALALRPNFALAALNLAAWRHGSGGQLDEAVRLLIENCATGTEATRARGHDQHVRVQIECLISAARLTLAHFDSTSASPRAARRRQGAAAGEAETAAGGARPGAGGAGGLGAACSGKILDWMRLARAKVKQIAAGPQISRNEALDGLGDLNKQLASIHLVEARCRELAGEQAAAAALLDSALEFAMRSEAPIGPQIYLACATEPARDKRAAINLLERAVAREKQKRRLQRAPDGLATLLVALARHYAAIGRPREALARVEEALGRPQGERGAKVMANHLTLAGQLAYECGEPASSERFYGRALATLEREGRQTGLHCDGRAQADEARKQLASAHANYGAIVQVNGRLGEARAHYRRALDCDQNNPVAATNLKRISPGPRQVGAPERLAAGRK